MMTLPWYEYALAAAVFSSTLTVFRKSALKHTSPQEFDATRSMITILLLLPVIPSVNFDIGWKLICTLMFLSALLTTVILNLSKCYKNAEISLINPILNIKLVLVTVLAFIFLGERISLQSAAGIFLIVVGIYLLNIRGDAWSPRDFLKNISDSPYSILALRIMILASVVVLLEKYIVTHHVDPVTLLFFLWLFSALFMNVANAVKGSIRSIPVVLKKVPIQSAAVACCAIGAYFCYLKALSLGPASLVIPVLKLSTFFTIVVGGLLFEEKRLRYKAGVSVFILAGVWLIIDGHVV